MTEHQEQCRQLQFLVEVGPVVEPCGSYYLSKIALPYEGLVVGAGVTPDAAINRSRDLFNDLCIDTLYDNRYSMQREWAGYEQPMLVVRFCGDWLGCAREAHVAWRLAAGHKAARQAALWARQGQASA